jgi:hypothetical protein
MNISIKPIETMYWGYRFRSRLEARWAVFFDAAGIEWEYEAQGFEINGRNYLPDFWLPRLKTYVEVEPNEEEAEKAKPLMQALAQGSSYCAQIVIGAPEYDNPPSVLGYLPHGESGLCHWAECQFCGRVCAQLCWCTPGGVEIMKRPPQSTHLRVKHAMDEAQGARFEHGEDGRPQPYCAPGVPHKPVRVYVAGVVTALPPSSRFTVRGFDEEPAAAAIPKQVADCEILFAWVDRGNIVHRMIEIGAARAKNIPIFIAFSKNEPSRHFYFASQLADAAVVAPSAGEAWKLFTQWRDMEDAYWPFADLR